MQDCSIPTGKTSHAKILRHFLDKYIGNAYITIPAEELCHVVYQLIEEYEKRRKKLDCDRRVFKSYRETV